MDIPDHSMADHGHNDIHQVAFVGISHDAVHLGHSGQAFRLSLGVAASHNDLSSGI